MHYRLEAARVLMQHAYQRLSAISANSAARPLGVTIIRFSGLPAVEQHTIDGFDNWSQQPLDSQAATPGAQNDDATCVLEFELH